MTPAERLRKNQRMLDKAIRELDQTRVKLEKQEKTLIQQIKTSAKNGQMGACKIQAKDLVRTRRYIEKFFSMRSQLQKISLRLQVSKWRGNPPMVWVKNWIVDAACEIDISNKRTDDAGHEGRHTGSRQYEQIDESSSAATYRNGIRTRKRYYGTKTRNDG